MIRQAIYQIDKEIRKLEMEREQLQLECKHKNTFIGEWMWRVGATYKAKICKDCNSMIKNLDELNFPFSLTTSHP